MLIFHKQIDQSVLKAGFTIPVTHHELLQNSLKVHLKHGEAVSIELELDGLVFQAVLTNLNFDRKKYPNRKDIIQVRYSQGSDIAIYLRNKFSYTVKKVEDQLALRKGRVSDIAEDEKEYIAVYTMEGRKGLSLECVCKEDMDEEITEMKKMNEVTAENYLESVDVNTALISRPGVNKYRKMNCAIITGLKEAYDYRCQICGQKIGAVYASTLIHAHHIDYFTKSLNNDSSNLMIVCPNHHGIIHDRNPIFDRSSLTYMYPNGYIEGLMLNKHLKNI